MKVETKFKCYDCGKTITGKLNVVMRHAPRDQDDSVRVTVCGTCQHGIRTNAPRQTAERSGASLDAVVGASESKGK